MNRGIRRRVEEGRVEIMVGIGLVGDQLIVVSHEREMDSGEGGALDG